MSEGTEGLPLAAADPAARKIGPTQIAQSLLGFAIAAALLIWGLPRVAETTWTEIGAQLSGVGAPTALLMVGLMLLGLYCYTFTFIGSLPGLTHLRALMVNAAGSMVANMLPAGGALGAALSYLMFRSWGFTKSAISTSLVATGVWNLLARVILPMLGALVIIIDPAKTPDLVSIGAIVAAALAIVIVSLFIATIYSDKASHLIGHGLTRLLRPFNKRIPRGGDVDAVIQEQRSRMASVVRTRGLMMTLGLAGMFGFFFLLYVVASRTMGVEVGLPALFVAYAFRQFLTVLAITPGGLGITEVGTAGVLVAFGAAPSSAASAALLFAIFTALLEVPLGVLAWAAWWIGGKGNGGGGGRPGSVGDQDDDDSIPSARTNRVAGGARPPLERPGSSLEAPDTTNPA